MSTDDPAHLPAEMGKCTVTGEIVPADELVPMFGQQVSAEGKAILLSRLQSGERPLDEMDRPSILRRFTCILIDIVVLAFLLAFVATLNISQAIVVRYETPIIPVILTVIEVFYFAELHALFGCTVGKLAGGLRVVDLHGSPVSRKSAYWRAIIFPGPSLVVVLIFASITLFLPPSQVYPATRALRPLHYVGIGWFLFEGMVAFFDQTRQRTLHDRLAHTRVIVK